ncbi:MAG: HD-GYP domain-containing protein, partial [Acidimicrobiales bacterium]
MAGDLERDHPRPPGRPKPQLAVIRTDSRVVESNAGAGEARNGSGPATDPANGVQDRWASRCLLAWIVRTAIFLVPLAASVTIVIIAARVVPKPPNLVGTVIWWFGITAAATLALRFTERALRRFLPVVAFLRLSLVFPDKAPSRFRMAIRSGTVKQLQRRYEGHDLASTPQTAAETLLTLSAQLNVHDRLTRGHSERVRAYSALIAQEMGVARHQRDLLQWAALLHDIGKLDIPANILNKKGAPTANEWMILKGHPAKAKEHLEPLSGWLGEWRHAATQHHERWEGGGYPRGLRGGEISLAGRIVAVADAYDTITSVRSYKAAPTAEEGRAEIARSAGTHFDPAVVKAFLAVSGAHLQKVLGPMSWLLQAPILAGAPTAAV